MLSLKEDGDAAGLSGALPSNLLRVPGSPPALGLLRISLPGSVGPARNDRRKRHSKAVRASGWRSRWLGALWAGSGNTMRSRARSILLRVTVRSRTARKAQSPRFRIERPCNEAAVQSLVRHSLPLQHREFVSPRSAEKSWYRAQYRSGLRPCAPTYGGATSSALIDVKNVRGGGRSKTLSKHRGLPWSRPVIRIAKRYLEADDVSRADAVLQLQCGGVWLPADTAQRALSEFLILRAPYSASRSAFASKSRILS